MKRKVHVEISREQASALFSDLAYPQDLPRKRKKQAKKAMIKRLMEEFKQWCKQQNIEL
jgi:hypothetical protein